MAQNIRPAAVAGKFYDADRESLTRTVARCYKKAETMAPLSREERDGRTTVQAVVVPHAGYVFSGAVAAAAYLRLDPEVRYKRIFLLGPSHHVAFDGASVASAYSAYSTPLGNVDVDTATCMVLQQTGAFGYVPAAHDREHCLEVQLPLLQYRMKYPAPIVPIIIGTQDTDRLMAIAKALQPYFTADNLFVISSDFSHYPSYDDALTVDSCTGHAIATGSLEKFQEAVEHNGELGISNLFTSACGQCAIAVMLAMAQQSGKMTLASDLRIKHIAYLNSGDSPYGGKKEVVGYHAFALFRDKKIENDLAADDSDSFTLTANDKQQLKNLAWNAIAPARMHRPVTPTPVFESRVGVFVTLTEYGHLRGCIGHFGEDVPLGRLTEEMARAAAFEDPRFRPVTEDELSDIELEISVLTPLKRITDISQFDYGRQGIYIKKGGRSGTFLPQVAKEVNWTKEEFLGHCSQDKAGLGWDGWRTADLYTYEAIIF
ncbi:AmmeMemoRadiSam system protein B [uncultured Prevotella sp.]|uniref:AmmeMemoRadiSam system protein B n=1 Tax=uncultured Prevotella sp. TaxID=159272 RepID=UPI002593504D|nr:AmmeMemoRadiSam system protein B [uncultured Prevotella sp.]